MKSLLIILVSGTLVFTIASTVPDVTDNHVILSGTEERSLDLNDSSILAYCFTCHNPNVASHDEMLAPPLFGIKNHYLQATEGRVEFIQKMTAFIMNPTEDKALMKGPVRRFGLMPRHALTEDEIRKIVTYIYDNDIPAPAWYKSHHKKMNGNPN